MLGSDFKIFLALHMAYWYMFYNLLRLTTLKDNAKAFYSFPILYTILTMLSNVKAALGRKVAEMSEWESKINFLS